MVDDEKQVDIMVDDEDNLFKESILKNMQSNKDL